METKFKLFAAKRAREYVIERCPNELACENCNVIHHCNAMMCAFIEGAKTERALLPQWVSVADKIPPYFTDVMIQSEAGGYHIANLVPGDDGRNYWNISGTPTMVDANDIKQWREIGE